MLNWGVYTADQLECVLCEGEGWVTLVSVASGPSVELACFCVHWRLVALQACERWAGLMVELGKPL